MFSKRENKISKVKLSSLSHIHISCEKEGGRSEEGGEGSTEVRSKVERGRRIEEREKTKEEEEEVGYGRRRKRWGKEGGEEEED